VPGNNYAAEMALSPDGRRLYVAMATGRLSVIDTATRTVVANADYGGNPTLMTITPDGSRIFVVSTVVDAKGSHSLLSTYDAGSNTLIRASIDVGFLPTSMTLSTDGSRLYVADPATNNLYVIDTGKPYHFEPMSAMERRVVHMTVTELGGLRTESEGEGRRRHVVVFKD